MKFRNFLQNIHHPVVEIQESQKVHQAQAYDGNISKSRVFGKECNISTITEEVSHLEPKLNSKKRHKSLMLCRPIVGSIVKVLNHLWDFQLFAVFAVCFCCISCGNFLGYTSSAIPSMKKDPLIFASDLSVDISSKYESLIGGLGPLGALVGSLLTLLPLRFLGPRRTIAFIGVPVIFSSWMTIGFSPNIYYIFVGRFLGGLGVGTIISCAPLYVVEICNVSRRGQLGIMPQLLTVLGVLISYICGSFLNWKDLSKMCVLILLPSAFSVFFAPDSPAYLVSKGQSSKALGVLVSLEGSKCASESLQSIQDKYDQSVSDEDSQRSCWNRRTLKAFLVSLGIISSQQLTGISGVTFFAFQIFNNSQPNMQQNIEPNINDNIPVMVLGATQLLGSTLSTCFVEKLGRKFLLTLSSTMLTLSSLALGIYFYTEFKNSNSSPTYLDWIPLAALMIFGFGFAIGLGPVSWILVAEILPEECRHLINPIVISYNWFCVLIITSSFPSLKRNIDLYGIFWVYSCVAALAVLFIRLFVPETKGKSHKEIQEYFN